MTHDLQLIGVTSEKVGLVAPLFDAYRQFYGQTPDLKGAHQFVFERLQRGESVIFAVIEDANALGITHLYPSYSSVSMQPIWILNDLFVVEKARRLGIGARLLMAAREHAVQAGAVRLVLATAVENLGAQALYERQGWQKVTGCYHYEIELSRDTNNLSKAK
jgi:GNAT superfamily N-acetyltransferase